MNSPTIPSTASAQPWAILLGCIGAYCFSQVFSWLQPQVLTDSMAVLNLDATHGGMVLFAEGMAVAFSSIVLASFPPNLRFRTFATIGAVIALAGHVLSTRATSYGMLLTARMLAGLGEGAVLMVSNALVADFDEPDRAYAHLNTANILYGALALFALPVTFGQRTGLAIFLYLALSSVPLLPCFYWLSRRSPATHYGMHAAAGPARTDAAKSRLGFFCLCGAMLLLGIGSSAVWGFLDQFGHRAGLSDDQVNFALGVASFAGLLGSGLVAIIGTHFGRIVPFICVLAVATAVNFGLTQSTDAVAYRVFAAINVICMYFLLPYLLGYAATLDKSGRCAAIVGGVFMCDVALGPLIGGVIIDSFGMKSIGWAVALLNALTLILVVIVEVAVPKPLSSDK